MSSRPPEQPESTLDRIMGERRDKAAALRAAGSDPYRNDLGPKVTLAEVRARYEPTKPPPAPKGEKGEKGDTAITPIDGEPLRVAGRVMAKRGFGKTVFAPIRDTSGHVQLYLSVDHMDAEDFEKVLPQLDAGDIVVAEGPAFWTKRGELSILATRLWIVTKSLRPLPDKWHGLTDVELRYRQRYVDLAISPDVSEVFKKRSAIVRGIRKFLDDRQFLEVETPMMHPIIGGAAARPFMTHHNALDMKLYMRIAPELYLKRLVVGGFERVYEINRNFRNEGVSTRHNPEFTMLELYQAYATYTEVMDLTEAMIRETAKATLGKTALTWEGRDIDVGPPFKRWAMSEAVRELNPEIGAHEIGDRAALAKHCARLGIHVKNEFGAGRLLTEIFEATVEATLIQPTFITQYPTEVSPLARASDHDPEVTDRFELFIGAKEMANGFSELNDPEDQAERFLAQARAKDAGDDEAMHFDADYIRALEYGMPPAGGLGVGIDRLVMLFADVPSIRDVLLFPYLRPEA
jgi:lysyl-tRNA synthetase class 2